jgi:hypothetical protein
MMILIITMACLGFPYTLHTNELLGSLAIVVTSFGINAIYEL